MLPSVIKDMFSKSFSEPFLLGGSGTAVGASVGSSRVPASASAPSTASPESSSASSTHGFNGKSKQRMQFNSIYLVLVVGEL